MTFHELVDDYIRMRQTLDSFDGYRLNRNKLDDKFISNFKKTVTKFQHLTLQISKQIEKEDLKIVCFEIQRMIHPDLGDDSAQESIVKERDEFE